MTLLHKLLTTTLLCFAAVLHAAAQFRPEPPVTNFEVNGIFYVKLTVELLQQHLQAITN